MDNHKMVYLGITGSYHQFMCPICRRHVLLNVSGQPQVGQRSRVVLDAGDQEVGHSGSVGGVVISGVEKVEAVSDVWEDFFKELWAGEDD